MNQPSFLIRKPKLSSNDQVLFMKRLGFLLGAGISLFDAVHAVALQSKKNVQPILEKIAGTINLGQPLSKSLELFPNSFPLYAVKIIKAGEESSQLTASLTHVASEIQKRKNLKGKIISAAVYPMLIGFGTIVLSLFLVFGIFPKVRSLFNGMHATLPLSTRIIIWLSDFLHHFGIILLLFLIAVIFLFRWLIKKYPRLQFLQDQYLLSIPLIGTLISQYILSLFFRTLGIMLKAHIPISRSLSYASESITNKPYREALISISAETLSGINFASSLKHFPKLFPEISTQLIEVGEASSNLAETLTYLSDMYDQEIEQTLKILVSVIEPIMMALMGLVVGFISLSIITPIYAITQNIQH